MYGVHGDPVGVVHGHDGRRVEDFGIEASNLIRMTVFCEINMNKRSNLTTILIWTIFSYLFSISVSDYDCVTECFVITLMSNLLTTLRL